VTTPVFTYESFLCIVRYYPVLAALFVFLAVMVVFSGVLSVVYTVHNMIFRAGVWIMLAAACAYTVYRLSGLFATCSPDHPLVISLLR
jgi:hypothetical protein